MAQNQVTEQFSSLKWPIDNEKVNQVTFLKDTSKISQDEIQQAVDEKLESKGVSIKSVHEVQVMIKVLNADWLLADENNFAEFCNSLTSCNSGRIYDCDLLRVLANANWAFN